MLVEKSNGTVHCRKKGSHFDGIIAEVRRAVNVNAWMRLSILDTKLLGDSFPG
jgi:hypothetical protein